MPANYVLLEKITVGAAGASSVTFSSIPQTGYTDLKVVYSFRGSVSGANDVRVTFNGSTTSYISRILFGNGSTAATITDTNTFASYAGIQNNSSTTASTFSSGEIYVPNYTVSGVNKSFLAEAVSENNATTAVTELGANRWTGTDAITSVTLSNPSGDFVQGSTAYLYGVAKLGTTPVIVPYATGGDTIMTDGTYWYHTFISSGTFTPAKGLSVDCLVVAGGGGGGYNRGGGGGAGGFRTGSGLSVATSTNYTITVGAGGAGATSAVVGSNGSNSVFSTITSTGGGGAGGNSSGNSASGGSGGGAANGVAAGSGNTPSTSPSQGNNGGAMAGGGFTAAGGGGASAVGTNGASINTGNTTEGSGGAGTASSLSGSSVTYAGGGGGGSVVTDPTSYFAAGGSGGGGRGGSRDSDNAVAGTANTGGGGGGGASGSVAYVGRAGGSGIVIVRYAV
jgi:hypothetical protein